MTPFRFCLGFKTWRMEKENVFALLSARALNAAHIDANRSEMEVRLGNQQTGESLTLTSVREIDQDGSGCFLLRRSCLVGPLERSHFDKPYNCDEKSIKFCTYCS